LSDLACFVRQVSPLVSNGGHGGFIPILRC